MAQIPQVNSLLTEILDEMQAIIDKMRTTASHIPCATAKSQEGEITYQQICSLSEAMLALQRLLYIYGDAKDANRTKLLQILASNPSKKEAAIEIRNGEDFSLIKMPFLPRRTNIQDKLLYDILAVKLLKEDALPTYRSCSLSFVHLYPTNLKLIPKDNDNYAYKRVIDLIAYACGFSDCPVTMDVSMRTVFNDEFEPGTYIEIHPKSSDFPDFKKWHTLLGD